MEKIIWIDPLSREALPRDWAKYRVTRYNATSWLVSYDSTSYQVDTEDNTCTCDDYGFRKDPTNVRHSPGGCKHQKLIKTLQKWSVI